MKKKISIHLTTYHYQYPYPATYLLNLQLTLPGNELIGQKLRHQVPYRHFRMRLRAGWVLTSDNHAVMLNRLTTRSSMFPGWSHADAAEKTLPLRKVNKLKKFWDKPSPNSASRAKKHGERGMRMGNLQVGHYTRPNAPCETRCGDASGSALPLMKDDVYKSQKLFLEKTLTSASAPPTSGENPNVCTCASTEH